MFIYPEAIGEIRKVTRDQAGASIDGIVIWLCEPDEGDEASFRGPRLYTGERVQIVI